MSFVLNEFGNGYRPTADGWVLNRAFSFRVMNGKWKFVVGSGAAEIVWWYSPESELSFSTGGECARGLWHTDAIPLFLQALQQYLTFARTDTDTQDAILQAARSAISPH